MDAMGMAAEIAGYTQQEVPQVRASFLLLLAVLACSSAQAAPYDPNPWCAVYGGSWSGTSNCGFRTLQQCMATVSGMGGSCEPNDFTIQAAREGAPRQQDRPITVRTMLLAVVAFPARPISSTIDSRRCQAQHNRHSALRPKASDDTPLRQ
jgi:Protein of unknown function (DUF3551)